VLKKIVADDKQNTVMNGLGNLAVVDTDNDGLVDTVYGGDLLGNVWKFNLNATKPDDFSVSYDNKPLFTATYTDPVTKLTAAQPITGGFEVAVGPNGGYMLYFGTGRYFATGDNSTTDVQTVYGVWDNGVSTVTGRGVLASQNIVSVSTGSATTPSTRAVSSNAVNYLDQRGWYMDLTVDGVKTGERMIGDPRIQSGKIYFPTYVPEVPGAGTDCKPGGSNWLYGLNPLSGAAALGQVTLPPGTTTVGGSGTGAISTGSGAPSQGVGVTQPAGTLPSYCDPADASCVIPGTTSSCSEVVTDPTNSKGSITIQRMCGRQSWRQIK
jgi:type IV pilus assembly protein PilY1